MLVSACAILLSISYSYQYAARSARPGWEARWGSEEAARTSSPVSAADVQAMEARATATASNAAAAAHPAYTGETPAEDRYIHHRDLHTATCGICYPICTVAPCLECTSVAGFASCAPGRSSEMIDFALGGG